jgi:hypothetical protein
VSICFMIRLLLVLDFFVWEVVGRCIRFVVVVVVGRFVVVVGFFVLVGSCCCCAVVGVPKSCGLVWITLPNNRPVNQTVVLLDFYCVDFLHDKVVVVLDFLGREVVGRRIRFLVVVVVVCRFVVGACFFVLVGSCCCCWCCGGVVVVRRSFGCCRGLCFCCDHRSLRRCCRCCDHRSFCCCCRFCCFGRFLLLLLLLLCCWCCWHVFLFTKIEHAPVSVLFV